MHPPSRRGARRPSALARLDRYVEAAIRARAFPGAAVAFGRRGEDPVVRCYGHLTYEGRDPVTPRTRYDLSCLSKPMGVGTLVAQEVAAGTLDLHEPVAASLPAFGSAGKDAVTWTHLLAHAGGLAPSRSYDRLDGCTGDALVAAILGQRPRFVPGSRFEYSCDGFVVMGLALEARCGRRLDVLARTRVFEALGMEGVAWLRGGLPAPREVAGDVAPTARWWTEEGGAIVGEVSEPLARALGRPTGNTGLFGTIHDVARFGAAWLGDGPADVVDPVLARHFARPVDPRRLETRALAWDTRSPTGYTVAGRRLGPSSFGHTGATGCSLWLDPEAGLWVALLSNAPHEADGRRRYVTVRPRVSDLAAACLGVGG